MHMAKDMKMKGADLIKGIDRVSGIAMFFSDVNPCLLNGHRPKHLRIVLGFFIKCIPSTYTEAASIYQFVTFSFLINRV